MAGELIAQMIGEARNNLPSKASDIIFGRVVKVKPLEILVDERYPISGDLLVLMAPVKSKVISFDVSDQLNTSHGSASYVTNGSFGAEGSSTNKTTSSFVTGASMSSRRITLTIFKDLEVGEKVAMIKGQSNQVYYVLDRV